MGTKEGPKGQTTHGLCKECAVQFEIEHKGYIKFVKELKEEKSS